MSWGTPPAQNPNYMNNPQPAYGQRPAATAPAGYGRPRAPAAAGYRAPQPGYAPQQPGYAPQQPGHAPQQPGYAPQQPGYAPQQPGYAPPRQGRAGPPPRPPPPGIRSDVWAWFQAVDQDGSGAITVNELQRALMHGDWTPFNEETCRLMIGMFDKDRNGTISVHEFGDLWKYIESWKACFDRFDTDRSGNINANELHNALLSFGYPGLSSNFSALCVRVFDRAHRSTMKFDDFIQCCVMLKSLTDQFRVKDTQQTGVVRVQYEEFLRMVLDNSLPI